MSKKILYIEDERQIAEIYAELLRAHGYEVDLQFDGKSGLDQARSESYDVILLDLMLPQISGIDVLNALRDKTQSPTFSDNTYIIILTNFDVDDMVRREINQKAQGYLIKVEYTPKKLIEYLENL
jgi:two-component system, OmpR family, response regulator Irr